VTEWPSVDVLIPTRDRPQLLAEAIASITAQDYPGPLRVLVVFDQQDPDPSIASDASAVPVLVMSNARRPGLAGARNTGILASDAEYVAFCDDDDTWLPGKLRRQVRRLTDEPGAVFATTGIRVDFGEHRSPRLVG
jgi:glycosyltransferase involved in cell wall biosynthesis